MKNSSVCFDLHHMPGFDIAMKDLCLEEDFKLFDGTVFREGAKYFTFPDLKALLWHLKSIGQIPDEYDIPTDVECEQIVARYGCRDGIRHSDHLATSLGLGYYGYIGIISSVDTYNKSPQDFIYSQALGYGVTGSYWCLGTGKNEGKAMILHLNSSGEPIICRGVIDNGANIGCLVRLIKRHT